jgi:hypothetical protein
LLTRGAYNVPVDSKLLEKCRALVRMADAARRSSNQVIDESHALIRAARSIRRSSRQLRNHAVALAALRACRPVESSR